jgi:hypothetical protein
MIPRTAKYISFVFTNSITESVCFKISFPYDTKQPLNHAEIYKHFKQMIADNEQVDAEFISPKHELVPQMGDNRVIYEWPGGFLLDMPIEATAFDYEIVNKQLELLKLSLVGDAEKKPITSMFLLPKSTPTLISSGKPQQSK